MALSDFLDPFLSPFLDSLGSFWFVVAIGFLVSLLIVLVYKITTDQNLMKTLKEEIKEMNVKARGMMKNPADQQKAMGIHKLIMEKQMTMMKHSFKSMFITFLPIIIIFGWMTANLAFEPIHEGAQFTVTVDFDDYLGEAELIVTNEITIVGDAVQEILGENTWRMSGTSGEHLLEWNIDGNKYFKDIRINDEQKYADPVKKVGDGVVKSIEINYKKNILLNLLGWKMGWLATYILFAIIFNSLLRKILKVY